MFKFSIRKVIYNTDYNEEDEKIISLRLGFRKINGNEYEDYTTLFKDNNEFEINFDNDEKDNMCKLANLLYLSKTEMTCYETMLEDSSFDLLKENYSDVRKLQRMSRQALDKLREIKMKSSTE